MATEPPTPGWDEFFGEIAFGEIAFCCFFREALEQSCHHKTFCWVCHWEVTSLCYFTDKIEGLSDFYYWSQCDCWWAKKYCHVLHPPNWPNFLPSTAAAAMGMLSWKRQSASMAYSLSLRKTSPSGRPKFEISRDQLKYLHFMMFNSPLLFLGRIQSA